MLSMNCSCMVATVHDKIRVSAIFHCAKSATRREHALDILSVRWVQSRRFSQIKWPSETRTYQLVSFQRKKTRQKKKNKMEHTHTLHHFKFILINIRIQMKIDHTSCIQSLPIQRKEGKKHIIK